MHVSILIPIYKNSLTENESKSLIQLIKVLGKHQIIFFGPENLILKNYTAICPQSSYVSFNPAYFNSIEGYSQLMLSPIFYEKFLHFEYVLIYQLDAWVFEDTLIEWCKKGYDYIGAPWIEKPTITKENVRFDISKYFVNKVGNGGLSLRKVKSHYRNTVFFRPVLKNFVKNEDMFWGLFLYYLNPFFKRPKALEALAFAFEMNPSKSFEMNNYKLPFGVHAWEKYEPDFWSKYIYI